jgi:hypothetical protein
VAWQVDFTSTSERKKPFSGDGSPRLRLENRFISTRTPHGHPLPACVSAPVQKWFFSKFGEGGTGLRSLFSELKFRRR